MPGLFPVSKEARKPRQPLEGKTSYWIGPLLGRLRISRAVEHHRQWLSGQSERAWTCGISQKLARALITWWPKRKRNLESRVNDVIVVRELSLDLSMAYMMLWTNPLFYEPGTAGFWIGLNTVTCNRFSLWAVLAAGTFKFLRFPSFPNAWCTFPFPFAQNTVSGAFVILFAIHEVSNIIYRSVSQDNSHACYDFILPLQLRSLLRSRNNQFSSIHCGSRCWFPAFHHSECWTSSQ